MFGRGLIIPVKLNTDMLDQEIDRLTDELNRVTEEFEKMQNQPGFDEQSKEAQEYRHRILELINELIELDKVQNKQHKDSSKGFTNMLKSIKKVGLRMLGLASVYGIVSKASHAYLSKDTELAEKLQSVWVALGSFLAPVIEGIAEVMLKAIGYINEFVKALTGIDFIAKANAKALEKQAKAQKKLNNQTYDFDVIRTQQDNSSADSGVSASSGLIEIPQLNEGIVKKLKDLAYWLKENETWVKAVGIALLAVFGASAIAGLLSNIGGLIGPASGMGLAGLATLLAAIATVWIVTVAVKGVEEAYGKVQEMENSMQNLTTQVDNNTQAIKNWTNTYWEAEEQEKNNEKADKLFVDSLAKTSKEIMDNTKKTESMRKQWNMSKTAKKELENQEREYAKQLMIVNTNYKKLYEQGKLNDEGMKDYALSLEKQMELNKHLGYSVEELKKEYEKIDGKKYTQTIQLNADDSNARKTVSGLGDWIHNLFGNIFGGGSTKKYAYGGIVTQPTRALIGEAGYPEAVVPMTDDYLSTLASLIGKYSNGGSGTTNVYLDGRLIQRQVSDRQNQYNFSTNR